MKFKVGAKVQWKWLGRPIRGVVKEVFIERVTRVIKGKQIVRKGTQLNPAYLVVSEAGNEALKLQSELAKPEPIKTSKLVPKMFSDD